MKTEPQFDFDVTEWTFECTYGPEALRRNFMKPWKTYAFIQDSLPIVWQFQWQLRLGFSDICGSVFGYSWSGFWSFLGRVFNDFCSILWPGSDSAFHPSWGALGCPGPILMHAHGHGHMKSVRILKYTQICHRRDSPNRKRRPLGSSIERYKGSKWYGPTTLNFCNFDVL